MDARLLKELGCICFTCTLKILRERGKRMLIQASKQVQNLHYQLKFVHSQTQVDVFVFKNSKQLQLPSMNVTTDRAMCNLIETLILQCNYKLYESSFFLDL